MPVVCAI